MSPARAKVNRRKAKFFRNVHIQPFSPLRPEPAGGKAKDAAVLRLLPL